MSTERNVHLGVLVAGLVVAIAGFRWQPGAVGSGTHSGQKSAAANSAATRARPLLSIIPEGAAFILSLDVRALAGAQLGSFIAERLQRSAGAGKLTQACGFDPLLRLDQLALAIPSAAPAAKAQPDFGVIANGRFTSAEIMRCASTVIRARDGDPSQTKLGGFDTVRDLNAESGEIAAKDGLVVVSGGSYFRELLGSAERPRAASVADPLALQHAELRRALEPGTLVVTWLLSEGWFERITGAETNARLSPLRALKSLGMRLNVERTAQLRVLLECADSEAGARISNLLRELQSSVDALPLDPALSTMAKRVTVSQSAARVRLELEIAQAELVPLLDALGAGSTFAPP